MIDLARSKILVTGANGFLGGHVRAALAARGVPNAKVIAPRAEECDFRKREECERAVQGIDVVLHLAGITGDAEFHRSHPGEIFFDNVAMGMELLDASYRAGVKKFVFIGSVTEYPENAPLPFREDNLWVGPFEELHGAYTMAKKAVGEMCAAYHAEYGFEAVHLVMTNMYGPGVEPRGGFVIANIIRRMLEAKRSGAKSIDVWGTGNPTRDFLYVGDAAEGVVLSAERYGKPEPVNLGSGWEISVKELTELIARLVGFSGEVRWDTSKPDGVPRRMIDPTRAEREFGFRARTSFEDGLAKTIEWYGSHA